MKFFRERIPLFAILVLAALLRLWNLQGVPPSTSMDEASIGYNAYSVAKTGVDEFGDFPFISQRGYDDWRRSFYLFLVAPFVGIFGLGPVQIRLPAVILAVLTVFAVYGIALLLFGKKAWGKQIAYISATLWAISPWHIYLSRIGHETNAYVSACIFGLFFFLAGEKRSMKYLVSMGFFTLAVVAYYAGQVFIPLFGIGLLVLFWRQIAEALSKDKNFRLLFVLVAFLCLWVAAMTFSPSAVVRFGGTSTFKPEAHWQEYTKRQQLWNDAKKRGDIVGRIINSKYLFPVEVFFEAYTSHFRPRWLFANSSAEPFKAPGTGLLYLWQLPFIVIGILFVFLSQSITIRTKNILFLWFILAPLPGGIATGAPHAMRTYPSLFTWELFTALGIVTSLAYVKRLRPYFAFFIGIITLVGFVGFLGNYFGRFPHEQSKSFHYALSQAIPFVLKEKNSYKKVVFSNEDNLYQSYMLFLYYSKYDPVKYLAQGGTHSGGYAETHTIDSYEFRPIRKNEVFQKGTLYIGNVDDFPSTAYEIASFSHLDGTIAIKAVILP